MRRMIIVAVWLLAAGITNAQTVDEWFKQKQTQIKYLVEQIGALKAYGEVVNKGFDIAHSGLSNIFDSKDGDYMQHNSYFLSLWKVKYGIRNYSKVLSILKMKVDIEKQYSLVKSPTAVLNNKEKEYVDKVFSNLLNECDDLAHELKIVISDDQLQLKDDERIQRMDKIYFEMQDRYEFTQSFSNEVKLLLMNRLKDKNEINKLSSLSGIK